MHAFLICILYIRWMGSFTLGFVASLIVISKKTDKKNRYLLGRAVSVSSGVSKQSNYRRKFRILEVQLPTIWTDEKQSRAEAERRERLEERRSEKRKSQKKEDADARKGRKVAKHCVFPMIWGSGAKAAGAEPAGQMRDEKVHAVVARSTFRSQIVQNTPASEHFWKLRCRKSARRCVAKHISK